MSVTFVFKARDASRTADAYLYSYARLSEIYASTSDGQQIAMVEVTGRNDSDSMYLAGNQSARLNSGLYPTTRAFFDPEAALAEARDKGWLS